MEVTTAMVHAAIKQAVKDEILPKYAPMEVYEHHWEAMQRIIEAAISAEGNRAMSDLDYEYEKVKGMTVGQVVGAMLEGKEFYFHQKPDRYHLLTFELMNFNLGTESIYTRKERPWWEGCEGMPVVVESESGPKFEVLDGVDQSNSKNCIFVCRGINYKYARPLTTAERDAIKVKG